MVQENSADSVGRVQKKVRAADTDLLVAGMPPKTVVELGEGQGVFQAGTVETAGAGLFAGEDYVLLL